MDDFDISPSEGSWPVFSTATSMLHNSALVLHSGGKGLGMARAPTWVVSDMGSGPSVIHGPVDWPGRQSAHSLIPYHGRGAASVSVSMPNEARWMPQLSISRFRPCRAAKEEGKRSTGGYVVTCRLRRPVTGAFFDR